VIGCFVHAKLGTSSQAEELSDSQEGFCSDESVMNAGHVTGIRTFRYKNLSVLDGAF
jgi:hypothetical protein